MNVTDKIAEVLEYHQFSEYSWGIDGCMCDFGSGGDIEAQSKHQAEKIVEALGL